VGLLIDSTLLIAAERARLSPVELIAEVLDRFGDVDLAISVMSAGELFHGCWRADSPARRAQREEYVETVLAAVPAVPVTLPIMRVFGELDARLSAAGERLPTSDLLIGCTALSRGDALLTGNLRHFERIPGLVVHRW
jgi:predicted nucleic acid-binding protein